jgi:hypothetical protein
MFEGRELERIFRLGWEEITDWYRKLCNENRNLSRLPLHEILSISSTFQGFRQSYKHPSHSFWFGLYNNILAGVHLQVMRVSLVLLNCWNLTVCCSLSWSVPAPLSCGEVIIGVFRHLCSISDIIVILLFLNSVWCYGKFPWFLQISYQEILTDRNYINSHAFYSFITNDTVNF